MVSKGYEGIKSGQTVVTCGQNAVDSRSKTRSFRIEVPQPWQAWSSLFDEKNLKFYKISILQKSTQIRYFSWLFVIKNWCELRRISGMSHGLTFNKWHRTWQIRQPIYRTFGQVYRSIHSRIQFHKWFFI